MDRLWLYRYIDPYKHYTLVQFNSTSLISIADKFQVNSPDYFDIYSLYEFSSKATWFQLCCDWLFNIIHIILIKQPFKVVILVVVDGWEVDLWYGDQESVKHKAQRGGKKIGEIIIANKNFCSSPT